MRLRLRDRKVDLLQPTCRCGVALREGVNWTSGAARKCYYICQPCVSHHNKRRYAKNPELWKRASRKRREENPEEVKEYKRHYRRYREYGLSPEEYTQLVTQQNGTCAICGKPFHVLHVDHDHQTGLIRGLLCGSHNWMLGLAQDDVDILQKAIQYLEKTHA